MFEKWTKKVAEKATDGAVTGVKETLNDKLDTYSGIIKIGLTLAVIIFGSKKINDHHEQRAQIEQPALRFQQPQPIVINNYITDGRHGPNGGQRKNRK